MCGNIVIIMFDLYTVPVRDYDIIARLTSLEIMRPCITLQCCKAGHFTRRIYIYVVIGITIIIIIIKVIMSPNNVLLFKVKLFLGLSSL